MVSLKLLNKKKRPGQNSTSQPLIFSHSICIILSWNVFSRPPILYATFSEIGGLEKSNQVKINGLPVGTVYDIKQADKEVNKILVEIRLTRDIEIPINSVAFIDAGLLNSTYINVEKG